MIGLALAFFASFVFVFLKAMQTLNSVFKNYWWLVPTSVCIAFAEVFIIANVAQAGYYVPLILAVGFGSGFGALAASLLHHVVLGKRK